MRCSNKADREKHEAKKSCDYSEEAPPVPIPNTVVKLLSADDTWGVTPWEIRTSQVFLFFENMQDRGGCLYKKKLPVLCNVGGVCAKISTRKNETLSMTTLIYSLHLYIWQTTKADRRQILNHM